MYCICTAGQYGANCAGNFEADAASARAADEAASERETTQLIVLCVVALFLLIAQVSARYNRDGSHLLPYSVEVITYFSMLDLVTDITYVSTEDFYNGTLKSFGIVFVLMPFIALSVFFLFKVSRALSLHACVPRLSRLLRPHRGTDALACYSADESDRHICPHSATGSSRSRTCAGGMR